MRSRSPGSHFCRALQPFGCSVCSSRTRSRSRIGARLRSAPLRAPFGAEDRTDPSRSARRVRRTSGGSPRPMKFPSRVAQPAASPSLCARRGRALGHAQDPGSVPSLLTRRAAASTSDGSPSPVRAPRTDLPGSRIPPRSRLPRNGSCMARLGRCTPASPDRGHRSRQHSSALASSFD